MCYQEGKNKTPFGIYALTYVTVKRTQKSELFRTDTAQVKH